MRLGLGGMLALAACSEAAAPGVLHVAGGFIRDERGAALLLRGVSVSNAAKDPNSGFVGWHTAADFSRSSAWGFNAVRLLVFWEAIEPQPHQIDEDYLSRIDARVRWAGDAGLMVILDMHQDVYGRGFGHNGAPEWTCAQELYDGYVQPDPWYLGYLTREVRTCFDRFWASEDLRDHYARAWEAVAGRYAHTPHVIGFDLYNEPFWGSAPADVFEYQVLQPFYEELAARIERVAPGKLFFVQPTSLVQLGSLYEASFARFAMRNVVYAPHYYDAGVHDGRPYDGDATAAADTLGAYARTARRIEAAFWLGEYGAPSGAAGAGDYLQDVESLLGAHAAGGALWSYDRDSAFGLLDQGGAPKPDLMQAVARPYARVVGGNPVATSYDFAARTLSLHFRNRGGVEPWSVVYVGDHYAGGLRVTARDADGARVARDAAAGEIKVRVDPDIQEHVITLSPRSAP